MADYSLEALLKKYAKIPLEKGDYEFTSSLDVTAYVTDLKMFIQVNMKKNAENGKSINAEIERWADFLRERAYAEFWSFGKVAREVGRLTNFVLGGNKKEEKEPVVFMPDQHFPGSKKRKLSTDL